MPRPRGSTNPSLQELSSSQARLAADAYPFIRSLSSSIPAAGTTGGGLLQDSDGQDHSQQAQQQHFSSAFARAKALALEKTSKLRENSAILSELAKEKGANWKARAKAIQGSELSHHIWKGGKGRREKDHERSGGSVKSYDSAVTSNPTPAGSGDKRKLGGRREPEYSGAPTTVFGVPLKLAVEASRIDNVTSLPRVVVRCIEYLDAKGLNEVGIYRIPGSTTTVSKLRAAFDSGSDINFEKTYEDPNAVATLLKMFLRDLPEPVLTKHLDPVFNGCLSDYDHELSATDPEYERLISRRLAAVATHLPDENYELLAWLMCHLARVDYYSDINKMNCSNLGLIFCPTLGISSVMFRYFVGCCEDMFPLPRREPAGGEEAWGTPHYSGETVIDTCEAAAEGDSPQTADYVVVDADPGGHSPEAGPVSVAEGSQRSGGESELRQAEKWQNQNSVIGDFRSGGAHASTFSAADEMNNEETGIARRQPGPTVITPNRRKSSMPAESLKTSLPNSTARKPSTSPPPPPASPRRNQVRVVRSSFSMGDLIALSNSLDALDCAAAGGHTDPAGDVRQGILAQGRTGLSNGPGVRESCIASPSTPSSKSSKHALHAPSPLESAAAQQHRSLEPVPQSPAASEPDESVLSSLKSPRSLLAPERHEPGRQASHPSPLRQEQRNPPSAVGVVADPDPVKSWESESPESAGRPESGSILGLTSSDGTRVRTSDQLFEYFFAEAERRVQENEAMTGNSAGGEAAPARGGGGAVNLMD